MCDFIENNLNPTNFLDLFKKISKINENENIFKIILARYFNTNITPQIMEEYVRNLGPEAIYKKMLENQGSSHDLISLFQENFILKNEKIITKNCEKMKLFMQNTVSLKNFKPEIDINSDMNDLKNKKYKNYIDKQVKNIILEEGTIIRESVRLTALKKLLQNIK